MRDERRKARRRAIEQAAYDLLAERGYKASSMLAIAKRAGASNETLYAWYGSKAGLFAALVAENAREARDAVEAALAGDEALDAVLRAVGAAVLRVVTSERAIALNRAAVVDQAESGELGQAIARRGRAAVALALARLLAERGAPDPVGACERFLDLLIGDHQIRRAIGVVEPLDEEAIASRSARATAATLALIGRA